MLSFRFSDPKDSAAVMAAIERKEKPDLTVIQRPVSVSLGGGPWHEFQDGPALMTFFDEVGLEV